MEVPVAQLQRKSRWPVHPVRIPHDSILRLQWEAQEEGAIRHQHGEQDRLQLEVSLGVDLTTPNDAGHTPLEHAVAYKRVAVSDFFVAEDICDVSAVEYAARLADLDDDDDARSSIARSLAAFTLPKI